MASELIKGITFDEENVTSRNDSLFWHYHLSRTDTQYSTLNYGIYSDYNDGLGVTTSGLEITVRAGLAVAYGRNVEVELPTILTVGAGELGYVIINIDLNQTPTNQVSVETTTETILIQENLAGTGLQFQIPIGRYDSTSGNVLFTRDTNDITSSYIDNELVSKYVTLDTVQSIAGGKTFTAPMNTNSISDVGNIATAGTITSNNGYSNGGTDIAKGITTSGKIYSDLAIESATNVVANGRLYGTTMQLNGGNDNIIYGTTTIVSQGAGVDFMQFNYSSSTPLFVLGRNNNTSSDSTTRYIHASLYRSDGSNDAGLRIFANNGTSAGVRHVTNAGISRLAYATEVLNASINILELEKKSLELSVRELETKSLRSMDADIDSIILDKIDLISEIDSQIETYRQMIEDENNG